MVFFFPLTSQLSSDHGGFEDNDDSVVINNGLNAETNIILEDDNEPKIVNKIPNQLYENITGWLSICFLSYTNYIANIYINLSPFCSRFLQVSVLAKSVILW